jgi:hypothetical protein
MRRVTRAASFGPPSGDITALKNQALTEEKTA